MADKTIDPAATALGAMGLVTELMGALGRQGVLEMQQIADIFAAVEAQIPPGRYAGLSDLLSDQRKLAERFSEDE